MNDMILILNYSDELSMEIARRLRAEQVYARIISGMATAAQVKEIAPKGIILSGEAGGKLGALDEGILSLGLPVLAFGHAAHMLLAAQGGASAGVAIRGKTAHIEYDRSVLFAGLSDGERYVKEALTLMLPPEVNETAAAGGCTLAFEDEKHLFFGLQFELERNDPEGSAIIKNFARGVCGCSAWWSLDAALSEAERHLKELASSGGWAVCAVSGGVDSTVAAMLAHRAFGEKMRAIFVDTGLLREGEVETVCKMYEQLGIPLVCVDRSEAILAGLAGKRSPEEKRAVVVDDLYDEMAVQGRSLSDGKTLVLGTNYSDFLHNGSSAPNWKGLGMTVAEPLLELFKDEVRMTGIRLGMREEMAARKPFPALGLGARIVGEITAERLKTLRRAEEIFRDEIIEAGMERKLYKYFPVMLASSSFEREVILLRAVTLSGGMLLPARLPYDLIERTVERIMASNPAISRVFWDATPTPVGQESYA